MHSNDGPHERAYTPSLASELSATFLRQANPTTQEKPPAAAELWVWDNDNSGRMQVSRHAVATIWKVYDQIGASFSRQTNFRCLCLTYPIRDHQRWHQKLTSVKLFTQNCCMCLRGAVGMRPLQTSPKPASKLLPVPVHMLHRTALPPACSTIATTHTKRG